MNRIENAQQRKRLNWTEIIFFFIYFVVFPLISALQYRTDYNDKSAFNTTFIYFGLSSLFNIMAYLCYYKLILPRFLFTGKYLQFVVFLLLFIVLFDLYLRFIIDWSFSKMSFLPNSVTKLAADIFKRPYRFPRQSLTYTLMNLLSVTALGYFTRTLQKEREISELRQQHLQLELNALTAQLHPHFFFNTLNNIYSLALQQSKDTPTVVRKLADMMRYMLYETSTAKVQLTKEISFLGDYAELEQIRHDNNSSIKFDSQGESARLQIEPFLLLPFVENAFKHGLDQETGNGFVEIAIVINGNELILQVANSIPDIVPVIEKKGLGLVTVQKRLSLLYPGRHTLRITEEERSYRVLLTLSLSDAELPDR